MPAIADQITTQERETLAQAHRSLGTEGLCKACDVSWPCPTSKLLNRVDYLEDGYQELRRRIVYFSSPLTMQNAVSVARRIVEERLHGSG